MTLRRIPAALVAVKNEILDIGVAARFGSVDAAPGVEPAEVFTSRVTDALGRQVHAGLSPAMIVAHDAVNRTLLSCLVPQLGSPERVPQRTGCWNQLILEDGIWSAPVIDAVPGDGRTP